MEEKVNFVCMYIYTEKGKDKTAEYTSHKYIHNLSNPTMIANILISEIKKEVGHTVKELIMFGKVPAGSGVKPWEVVE